MCFKKFKEDSVQISSQRSQIPSFRLNGPVMRLDAHQCPEVLNCSRLHPSAHHCLTRNRISFSDRDIGRQLHLSGRQVYTVWMLSLISKTWRRITTIRTSGQHRLDAWPTPSGPGPIMVLREARYGKPAAQLSVRTISATVQTPPREIIFRLNLGLLSL
jgi:hypothetical protein